MQVFDHFPKYHTKNLLGDFTAELKRNDICKPTIGNESLLQDSNDDDDDDRRVTFATSKSLVVKSATLPHRNIHKHIWTYSEGRLTTRLITY